MATTKYYTVVFLNSGTPTTGLTPAIDAFLNVATGASLTPVPSVSEYSNGIYAFSIDWTNAGYAGVDEIIARVDGGASLGDSDRYIYGVSRRTDELDNYGLLDAQVLGNWVIANNQLKLYKEDGTLVQTFDLADVNGNPTNTAAISRIKA